MQAALIHGISRAGQILTLRRAGDLETGMITRARSADTATTPAAASVAAGGETGLPARAAGAAWVAAAAGAVADLAAAAAFEVAAGSEGSSVALRQGIGNARENGGGNV